MLQIDQFPMPMGAAKSGVVPFPPKNRLLPCRAAERLPKPPVSVLLFSFPYASRHLKGNISKYAMVHDYHRVIGSILNAYCNMLAGQTGGVFVPFVDNSPLPEVSLAASAGLGFLGKNHLIIDPDYGSCLFLGAVVSNLPFASTEREIQPCMNCGRCQTACPGNALSETHFQREACFSEITQKKKAPTEAQIHIIQKHRLVWGCDICQDVCPMNRGKLPTSNPLFLQDIICELTEEVILNCYRERAFGFRGAKVPLRNLKLIEQK